LIFKIFQQLVYKINPNYWTEIESNRLIVGYTHNLQKKIVIIETSNKFYVVKLTFGPAKMITQEFKVYIDIHNPDVCKKTKNSIQTWLIRI